MAKILELEEKYNGINFQNLTQRNIKMLCENKDITALTIKRNGKNAWIWCHDCDKLVGVSKKYTNEQADNFYDKMSEKYGV